MKQRDIGFRELLERVLPLEELTAADRLRVERALTSGAARDIERAALSTIERLAEGGVLRRVPAPPNGTGAVLRFQPRDSLRHELRALSSVFGPKELVTILTKNAAICADVDDITGTLAVGKQADLVMIDGDPLKDIFAVLDVRLVVKGGKIVSDQR